MNFSEKRRQQFLIEMQYSNKLANLQLLFEGLNNELIHGDNDNEDRRGLRYHLANDGYNLLSLHYTAGEPIEPMRHQLENVILAYEQLLIAARIQEQDNEFPAFYYGHIDEFERLMQLIGLAYLLHRRDLLPRIAALVDSRMAGQDTCYEDLLAYEMEGRYETDQLFFKVPYDELVLAMYYETKEGAVQDIQKYCDTWYPAMKLASWHDQHQFEDGAYAGYWAFEAGAVAFLLELDDSSIDHMVYPKDLVEFARNFKPDENDISLKAANPERLRCGGGQPCPKTGYWSTPALKDSRDHFKQGDIMPNFKSEWGQVIWQFEGNE